MAPVLRRASTTRCRPWLWLALLACSPICLADGQEQSDPLLARMQQGEAAQREWLASNNTELDFRLRFQRDGHSANATVSVILADLKVADMQQALRGPGDWCQVLFLHLNVKACTWREGDDPRITVYLGRKHYQEPEKAEPLNMVFDVHTTEAGVLILSTHAAEGPLGTSDYRFRMRAIDSSEGVYLEFFSTETGSKASEHLEKIYFRTVARDKVGFTVVGQNDDGTPQYVGGQQGALERNIVRYLLALEVWLQSDHGKTSAAFLNRAAEWFDLTEQHARQLHELDRREYLDNKRRELFNQQRLQAGLADD